MSIGARLLAGNVEECLDAMQVLAEQPSVDAAELQALAASLGHARKIVQRRAAETFAVLHARSIAIDAVLSAALRSPLPRQRWGAVFAFSLVGTPPPAALPVLLEALGTDDGDIRWAAAHILVGLEDQGELIETLQTLLQSGTDAQRKMAAYCLRDVGARRADVERAITAALADTNAAVRLAAMSGLTRVAANRTAVAQQLTVLLDDADQGVRRAAAARLGLLGESSEKILMALRAAAASSDPSLRRAAERALQRLGGLRQG